jgi:hypothetical protein
MNLIKLAVVILISSFLTFCTSKSEQKIKVEEKTKSQIKKETLTEIDSVFEVLADSIASFVSIYDNWNDSYYWKSEKSDDAHFDLIRLVGVKYSSDYLLIEKRSSRKNSTDVVGYSVIREKEVSGKTTYKLETSFFRNGQEVESHGQVFMLSTVEELSTALKPFYKRLEEARQDAQKNISRIEEMADKS